jgi:hypothetical protein
MKKRMLMRESLKGKPCYGKHVVIMSNDVLFLTLVHDTFIVEAFAINAC